LGAESLGTTLLGAATITGGTGLTESGVESAFATFGGAPEVSTGFDVSVSELG
jgi:hypothetical protein